MDITTTVRRGSQALAAHDGVESVILFGSRARGTAHRDSDTDLVLAGPGPASEHRELIAEAQRLVPGSDVVWLDTAQLDGLRQGMSIWPNVARDGIVLAGNETVLRALNDRGSANVDAARWQASVEHAIDEITVTLGYTTNERWDDPNQAPPTQASANAGEELVRLTLASYGVDPGPRHQTDTDRKRWYDAMRSQDAIPDPQRDRINELLIGVNGNITKQRNAVYTGIGEPREAWLERTRRVAEGLVELLDNTDRKGREPTWFAGLHEREELTDVRGRGIEALRRLETELARRKELAEREGDTRSGMIAGDLLERIAATRGAPGSPGARRKAWQLVLDDKVTGLRSALATGGGVDEREDGTPGKTRQSTMLHTAVRSRYPEIVSILLEASAPPVAEERRGGDPGRHRARTGHERHHRSAAIGHRRPSVDERPGQRERARGGVASAGGWRRHPSWSRAREPAPDVPPPRQARDGAGGRRRGSGTGDDPRPDGPHAARNRARTGPQGHLARQAPAQ